MSLIAGLLPVVRFPLAQWPVGSDRRPCAKVQRRVDVLGPGDDADADASAQRPGWTSWRSWHPAEFESHSTRSSRTECGGMLPGRDQRTGGPSLPPIDLIAAADGDLDRRGERLPKYGPTPRTVWVQSLSLTMLIMNPCSWRYRCGMVACVVSSGRVSTARLVLREVPAGNAPSALAARRFASREVGQGGPDQGGKRGARPTSGRGRASYAAAATGCSRARRGGGERPRRAEPGEFRSDLGVGRAGRQRLVQVRGDLLAQFPRLRDGERDAGQLSRAGTRGPGRSQAPCRSSAGSFPVGVRRGFCAGGGNRTDSTVFAKSVQSARNALSCSRPSPVMK